MGHWFFCLDHEPLSKNIYIYMYIYNNNNNNKIRFGNCLGEGRSRDYQAPIYDYEDKK